MNSQEFLTAAKSGDVDAVTKALHQGHPTVVYSCDHLGNNALHLSIENNHHSVVEVLTERSDLTPGLISKRNDDNKTPLQLAFNREQHDIPLLLLKRTVGWVTENDEDEHIFAVLANVSGGDNMADLLHSFAFANYAKGIKFFNTNVDDVSFMEACLRVNADGNLPAMVAAKENNKDALLALMAPFMLCRDSEKIDTLLHHRNKLGHGLLTYVVHHEESLFVAQGILIELEVSFHNNDSYAIKKCLRHTLGSTVGGKHSLAMVDRIRKNKQDGFSQTLVCLRVFSLTFFLRTFFFVADIFTDGLLLHEYLTQWYKEIKRSEEDELVLFPGRIPESRDPCLRERFIDVHDNRYVSYVKAKSDITLECYPGIITGRERFMLTLIMILLPYGLYIFEVLRFRLFSRWLDKKHEDPFCCWDWLWRNAFKLLGNLLLWIFWPFVVFFRHFLYRFRFETATGERRVGKEGPKARAAATISARAQIIDVCTESSLQPLFQFYLVYQGFITWARILENPDEAYSRSFQDVWDFFLQSWDSSSKQIISVVVSVLALSWSYTAYYRNNKENAMGFTTLIYFSSTFFFVVARIMAFEMFAYYLGPGNFMKAMFYVVAHTAVMSVLHFVFSDSLGQCRRIKGQRCRDWCRQVLLVIHNCVLNGLANIYIHNNIEIFIARTHADSASKEMTHEERRKMFRRQSTYHEPDQRQPTLVRQILFELIFLSENVGMIFVAKDTITSTPNFEQLYQHTLIIISFCYVAGMIFKITFYCCCHFWAELIRPKSSSEYESSCIFLSHHVGFKIKRRCCCCCICTANANDTKEQSCLPMNRMEKDVENDPLQSL